MSLPAIMNPEMVAGFEEHAASSGVPLYEDEEEEEVNFLRRCLQKRFILAGMGFWCFFVLSALRLNFGLAIVAMVNWTSVREEQHINVAGCNYTESEETPTKEDGPFVWDTALQGYILGSYFYGLAATQLLGGRLSEMVSAKVVLLAGTLAATASTLLVPVAATHDGLTVVALQVLKGLGQGIMMPSFSVLMGKWIPPVERARFMSFIASGMPVGGFLTVILSGYICKVGFLGWPFVFYIFGAIGASWCLMWALLIHDSPLKHPRITRRELNRIMSLRSQKAPQLHLSVPVWSILRSGPVWAYIIAGFASFWCLSLYVSVVPLFMGTILKFDIETNGTMSAIPNLVEAFFLIFTSLVSDYLLKKKILGPTVIRKIAISTGLLGYAVCMIIVSFTGCNRSLSVFFLVMALGMSGFNFASTAVVPVDMSPRFAGTLSGMMSTFGALSGVVIPSLIGYLTRERQTMAEWSIIFYASAGICIFAVVVFVAFGSSEVQAWNSPPPLPTSPSDEAEFYEDEDSSGPSSRSKRSPRKERDSSGPSMEKALTRQKKKSQPTADRPWRTDSFPDTDYPHSPAIVLRLA